MEEKLTLKNTHISFTPSFMGSGWETSLLPRMKRKQASTDLRITFSWIGKLFAKMQKSRRERKEATSWTTPAIAK